MSSVSQHLFGAVVATRVPCHSKSVLVRLSAVVVAEKVVERVREHQRRLWDRGTPANLKGKHALQSTRAVDMEVMNRMERESARVPDL